MVLHVIWGVPKILKASTVPTRSIPNLDLRLAVSTRSNRYLEKFQPQGCGSLISVYHGGCVNLTELWATGKGQIKVLHRSWAGVTGKFTAALTFIARAHTSSSLCFPCNFSIISLRHSSSAGGGSYFPRRWISWYRLPPLLILMKFLGHVEPWFHAESNSEGTRIVSFMTKSSEGIKIILVSCTNIRL